MGNSQGKPVVFTDEGPVNLNHFRLLRVVGKGAFGKVRIVERKDTGLTFALKYIRKDEIVRSESVRNIIRERRMLEHLNHPFLCNLRYSFQDIEYLYIVVDLMNGGDLRFHIARKAFTEDTVRFWMAELACALRYIHKQGIVHRDLKPDNVLLDDEGHVHLADFNVASDFTPGKLLSSRSGTLAYLAPEVYAGRGYSCEVDWWSLGVTFFECIYNRRPFKSGSHDKLSKEIREARLHFPITQPPVTTKCMSAMAALLERDRSKRIGAIGFETFTRHPFFRDLDFEMLEAKQIEPIFRPSSDKTNFDATYDLEELLLEEAPLEARARRQKPRDVLKDDATDKEIREDELHRMIESLFMPFDYTAVTYDRYPGTLDVTTKSVGPPPEWVRPSEAPRPTSNPQSNTDENDLQIGSAASGAQGGGVTSSAGSAPFAETEAGGVDLSQNRMTPTKSMQSPSPATTPGPTSAPVLSSPTQQAGSTRGPGGVQVVLNETGDWSGLVNQSSTPLADEKATGKRSHAHGVLGFLTRKHGRSSSPKPQDRGVLGREGARHIIG